MALERLSCHIQAHSSTVAKVGALLTLAGPVANLVLALWRSALDSLTEKYGRIIDIVLAAALVFSAVMLIFLTDCTRLSPRETDGKARSLEGERLGVEDLPLHFSIIFLQMDRPRLVPLLFVVKFGVKSFRAVFLTDSRTVVLEDDVVESILGGQT